MVNRVEECGPWLIVVDSMNYIKAEELGKAMGANGVTGRFMRGVVADRMAELAKLRKVVDVGERDEG